jgi:tryptophan halogenase
MTAAYLSKALSENVEIKLVESSTIGTVGVGEATFSTVRLFFDFLGLREEDWMHQCNASYKVAIRFENWNPRRPHFYHPFERFEHVEGASIIEWWLKLRRKDLFDYSCFSSPAICDAKRSPRFCGGTVFDPRVDDYLASATCKEVHRLDEHKIQYPYGYHFDASLIAKFMAHYAQRRGVQRIVDDVVAVDVAENGFINSITTKNQGQIEADLFIDCTGFRGLLINKTLGEPFTSFTPSLPCDSAIALQVPSNPQSEGIRPYTTATALSSGWVWDIPLFHRTGTGYVYSSAFQDADSAEREFRQHLGRRADGLKPLHIKIRVGRNRNSWVRNCVAIGLSSGFVEPLESTGIFFIQYGIEQLVANFPKNGINSANVEKFNRAVADCIDGVREFLVLHYVAASRMDTPFWRATKTDLAVPDGLTERLRLWRRQLPTPETINPRYHGFEYHNYAVMLLGLGVIPDAGSSLLENKNTGQAFVAFDSISRRSRDLVEALPPLYEYLAKRYRQEAMSLAAVSGY